MTSRERNKMTLIWAVLGALIAAVYWLNRLCNGYEVPEWSSIQLAGSWALQLPCGISRWLDVPFSAMLTAAFYRLATTGTVAADKYARIGLLVGTAGGLLFGLFVHDVLIVAASAALLFAYAFGQRLITGKNGGWGFGGGWALGASACLFPTVMPVFAVMLAWSLLSDRFNPWPPEKKPADDGDAH